MADPIVPCGHSATVLVIIRGNSGSGKSSIARQLQLRHGRGCAWVEQDHLRRIVLRERDRPGGAAPDLIAHTVRFALDRGYHVVLDGILHRARYAPMLTALCAGHRGRSLVYYLDVPLEETLRRHRTRPQHGQFTEADMRGWYLTDDRLGWPDERIVSTAPSLADTVSLIADQAGLPLNGVDDDFQPGPPPTPAAVPAVFPLRGPIVRRSAASIPADDTARS